MGIHAKLLSIQSKLKAPKSQHNSFGNYNYRSAEDILESLKPVCVEVGAVLTVSDSLAVVGGSTYVEATATLTDIETGESVSVQAYGREEVSLKGMTSPQITGATSSYARKYALNGLFAIDDNKDPDTDEHAKQQQRPASEPKAKAQPKAQAKAAEPKVTKEELAYIKDLFDELKTPDAGKKMLLAKYKVNKFSDLTPKAAEALVSDLQNARAKKQAEITAAALGATIIEEEAEDDVPFEFEQVERA